MKNYKIVILFILMSVISFGTDDSSVNVSTINMGVTSTDPITFKLKIKLTSVAKFTTPYGSITNISIYNGDDTYSIDGSFSLSYDSSQDEEINSKLIYIFYASIPADGVTFVSDNDATISGSVDIYDADGSSNALEDKETSYEFSVTLDENLSLERYEEFMSNWKNLTTDRTGEDITVDNYKFTKGGSESYESDPGVYVTGTTGIGTGQIVKLKVSKNGGEEEIITLIADDDLDIATASAISMKISGFESNEKNTVTVTPISVLGLEGSGSTLDFLVDTEVNDTYLEDGIIGELNSDGEIEIDLSSLEELSGIAGYSYTFTVGDESKSITDCSVNETSPSSITLSTGSTDEVVVIDPSDFVGGSKGTLLFTVYDKLGHEKTFQKTYFIPKEIDGVSSKVEDELKYRNSKIRIVTEGSNDKFGIESNIDKSSE